MNPLECGIPDSRSKREGTSRQRSLGADPSAPQRSFVEGSELSPVLRHKIRMSVLHRVSQHLLPELSDQGKRWTNERPAVRDQGWATDWRNLGSFQTLQFVNERCLPADKNKDRNSLTVPIVRLLS